ASQGSGRALGRSCDPGELGCEIGCKAFGDVVGEPDGVLVLLVLGMCDFGSWTRGLEYTTDRLGAVGRSRGLHVSDRLQRRSQIRTPRLATGIGRSHAVQVSFDGFQESRLERERAGSCPPKESFCGSCR